MDVNLTCPSCDTKQKKSPAPVQCVNRCGTFWCNKCSKQFFYCEEMGDFVMGHHDDCSKNLKIR